jgi:drug/metabolite transporter (DMT)-like permease
VFYVTLLKESLSLKKWLALIVLAIGMMVKFFSWDLQIVISPFVSLLFLQASLSSFAGVYNEYLLKKDMQMDVFEQNFFMYSFGIAINLIYLLYFNFEQIFQVRIFDSPYFYLVILNGILIGITTSLILKYVNSIVKGFASAVEIFLTSLASMIFLNASLTAQDMLAAVIVTGSIALYNYA